MPTAPILHRANVADPNRQPRIVHEAQDLPVTIAQLREGGGKRRVTDRLGLIRDVDRDMVLPAAASSLICQRVAGDRIQPGQRILRDVVDDDSVVITGSHNLGYKASYNNDENMAIIRGHRALAEAYAAHCLDVYDHYAWRYWLSKDTNKAWHFLASDDTWQDGYFSADNQVKSAELGFWLSATPAAEALPAPAGDATTRARPAIQAATGGVTPAVGPHALAHKRRARSKAKAH